MFFGGLKPGILLETCLGIQLSIVGNHIPGYFHPIWLFPGLFNLKLIFRSPSKRHFSLIVHTYFPSSLPGFYWMTSKTRPKCHAITGNLNGFFPLRPHSRGAMARIENTHAGTVCSRKWKSLYIYHRNAKKNRFPIVANIHPSILRKRYKNAKVAISSIKSFYGETVDNHLSLSH